VRRYCNAGALITEAIHSYRDDVRSDPRNLEADCARLEAEGVEIVFAPSIGQMYPTGATTVVHVQELSDKLDGRLRPGHFRGVSAVVTGGPARRSYDPRLLRFWPLSLWLNSTPSNLST
jgi:hypothetical protein